MGQLNVKELKTAEEKAQYIHHLIKDLEALEKMIDSDVIESAPIRIGAEQEFCITTQHHSPAINYEAILKSINDAHFTTEIGQYNLEVNSDPLELKDTCFSQLHKNLEDFLIKAQEAAHKNHSKIVLTGILPTLRLKHISEKHMTNRPRYHVLNAALKSARTTPFNIHIKGVDELNLLHNCVMLEACNTSFQMHLQIKPNEFVDKYNWAQAIAGPVLAASTNSPLLFGRELWAETRIALFTQSIDTRSNSFIHKEKQSRVSFGNDWEHGKVTDIFKDHISRFRSLLTTEPYTDSLDLLNEGKIPKLQALQLHNGTVYKWNRVCYGVGGGKPHLRIECRYIPAGPTLKDEIANMVFWVGLMLGQPKELKEIHKKVDFKTVKNNFFKAARHGIETQLKWNNKLISAKKLILNELLPMAKAGLISAGISKEDINNYLDVIKKRVTHKTGSQWLVEHYRKLQKQHNNFEALQQLTSFMEKHQLGEPIYTWGKPKLYPIDKRIVKHNMKTNIFLIREKDSLELVINIMKWKKIHHLPVINNEKQLIGMLSWTDIIKLGNEDLQQPVTNIMTKEVITISQEAALSDAKQLMKTHNINCLPVVRHQELLGVLTSNDL